MLRLNELRLHPLYTKRQYFVETVYEWQPRSLNKMVKQWSQTLDMSSEKYSSPVSPPCRIQNQPLGSLNAKDVSSQQHADIVLEKQCISFKSEHDICPGYSTEGFINGKLRLNEKLATGETVEEIEINLVSTKEAKIHALLLHITYDNKMCKNNLKVS